MSNNYADNLLQSMSIIAEQAVKKANYDRTIQATIISCVDPTIGKYKVNYQNGNWFAYSSNTNTTYTKGATVYVLIPGGDMNNTKTILGTTKQLGINYINTVEQMEKYAINGDSIVNVDEYGLCSYRKDNNGIGYTESIKNLFNLDDSQVLEKYNKYLKKSSHFIASMNVRTTLSKEQKFGGNYGINFYLKFYNSTKDKNIIIKEDGEEEEVDNIVIRKYTFDINNMEGNPYSYPNGMNQKAFFEIDSQNFIEIVDIEVFVKDFPETKSIPEDGWKNEDNDIFLSNISIYGADILSEEELNGVALILKASKGYIFSSTSSKDDTRDINAQVRVLGKAIDNNSQKLAYYWFVQDCSISSTSPFYLKYGGQGWKCLNKYKIIASTTDENKKTIPIQCEFNAGTAKFTVIKDDVKIKEQKYKCVVIYEDTAISKQFSIYNDDAQYSVTVSSDSGTDFIKDVGYPTLTCNVTDNNGDPVEKLNYSWSQTTYTGTFTILNNQAETDEYIKYTNDQTEYNRLKKGFDEHTILKNAHHHGQITNNDYCNTLENNLKVENKKQYVANNQIIHLNVKNITNFSTFTCTVFDEQYQTIGSASITIVNKVTSNGGYSLVINNGSQVFNYDQSGMSPCSESKDEPLVIQSLTFTLYDMEGNKIDQEQNIKKSDISWIYPIKDTMLDIDYTEMNNDGKTATKHEYSLPYSIIKKYSINRSENDIELRVKYQGYTLTAKTNFTFTKQGELGTNGTGFVLKIVPCNSSNEIISEYPVATMTKNDKCKGEYTFNFNHLEAQLWDNGQRIFKGRGNENPLQTLDKKPIQITWSILRNIHSSNNYDLTCFKIDNSGKVSSSTSIDNNSNDYKNKAYLYTLYQEIIKTTKNNNNYLSNMPANIVQLKLSYDGITYYATLPIISIYSTNSNFSISLVPNTGFRYAIYTDDGRFPQYDTHKPFTIKVMEKINGIWEDISLSKINGHKCTFNPDPYYVGSCFEYKNNTFTRIQKKYFIPKTDTSEKNTYSLKPADTYDGLCVNNAVCSVVTVDANPKVTLFIHIPVHFMLNKFSNAAINKWDGNSIKISDNEGIILSPQVGAGKKDDTSNTFTGILMGTVKKNNSSDQTGLFGYGKGVRTLFLDAETGNAEFGQTESGLIKITPGTTSTHATITGGKYKYDKTNGSGMQIDLSEPSIKFGSTNFEVTSGGNLTARGGGSIAGWSFDNDSFWKNYASTAIEKNDKNEEENIRLSTVNFNRTINGTSRSGLRLALGKNFGVTNKGVLYATTAILGSGTTAIKLGASTVVQNNKQTTSAIYTGNKNFLESTATGFYIGIDGISLGSSFQVTNKGKLTAKLATIGNGSQTFSIGQGTILTSAGTTTTHSSIHSGSKNSFHANTTGVYIGTDGISLGWNTKIQHPKKKDQGAAPFSVDSGGNLFCTAGIVGGWEITPTKIRSIEDKTAGIKKDQMYFGKTGLKIGENFSVDASGNLTAKAGTFSGKIEATSGHIAGWEISKTSLSTEWKNEKTGTLYNITIYKNGTIECKQGNDSKWKISSNGTATFQDITVNGGKWTDGTISGGNRTGGSITGGSIGGGGSVSIGNGTTIDVSQVKVDDKTTLKQWCENIVATSVTTAIGNISSLTVGSLTVSDTLYVNGGDRNIKVNGKDNALLGDVINCLNSAKAYADSLLNNS